MREEEKKRSSQSSKWKSLVRNRWFLPAIYIASAAIVLTAVIWIQADNNQSAKQDNTNPTSDVTKQPTLEVNKSTETFSMPLADSDSVVIKKEFYDVNGDADEQEAALVFYNNTYQPNTGIDYALKDGKAFNVLASMSGTVKSIQEDALLGNVIVVDHGDGVVSQYSSVIDFEVAVGDEVEQGQILAVASKSQMNPEAGTHTHFEIRKDSMPVNPLAFLKKPISSIKTATENTNEDSSANQGEEDVQ